MRYIQSATLAKWLGFSVSGVQEWAREGLLDRHIIKGVTHHSEESVMALLRQANHTMAADLTLDDFRYRNVRLIDSETAAVMLGVTASILGRLTAEAQIPALRFKRIWRFTNTAINAIKQQRVACVTIRDAQHVFGCSHTTVRCFARAGLLVSVRTPTLYTLPVRTWPSAKENRYTLASLVSATGHFMHPKYWHLADAWVKELLTSERPALTAPQVIHELGMSDRLDLTQLVRKGQIVCLGFNGAGEGNQRFLPSEVHRLFMQQPPLLPNELGRILATDGYTANHWLEGACPLHDHSSGLEYRHACIFATLRVWLSPGLTPGNWLQSYRSLQPGCSFIAESAVAKKSRLSVEAIRSAAAQGALRGLRRPNGTWVFAPATFRAINQAKLHNQLARYRSA